MAAYECPLDPESGATLRLHLYRGVRNIADIRSNVMSGAWPCAVIKPSLILHPFQVAVAANKAVASQRDGSMVTKSVFTELLFNLSLTKNISQSLAKFGIEKDDNILIAFIVKADEEPTESILSEVQGDPCPISDLQQFTEISKVKNVYKLSKLDCTDNTFLLDMIVSRMATKSFVSY